MDTKNCSISSLICVNGCKWPLRTGRPGNVMSIVSCSNLAANTAASICCCTPSKASSKATRTVFTKAPIAGRSSGDSLPNPFNNDVTSPFLPK